MKDTTTVIEGAVKYRDGKKWKNRWCVIRKLSPVADCLNLQLYRDVKERHKQGQTKASLSLEGFLAVESGFTLDKESNTLAVLCQDVTVVLAFDSRELLIQWQVKIRTNFGEEQQYLVQIVHVPPKSKVPAGPSRLHLQDRLFCLVSGLPPRLLGSWQLQDLRKYGVVDGKFCFEGGSRCGRGEGLHVMVSNQADEIAAAFDLASQGKLHNRRKTNANKTSVIDGTLRRSNMTPCSQTDRRIVSDMCSTESTRPLLNSSDSSICDACSEVVRLTGECWPSTESRELGSVDTLSVAISDIGGDGTVAGLRGWTPDAGAYLVDRVALLERCYSCCMSTPLPTSTSMTSSKWASDTVDNAQGSDSGEGVQPTPQTNGKLPDVMSVSSQGSSGNSSTSEYSIPRTCIETYYDTPRSVLALAGAPELPPRSPGGPKKPEQPQHSACQQVCSCGIAYPPVQQQIRTPTSAHKCVSFHQAVLATPDAQRALPGALKQMNSPMRESYTFANNRNTGSATATPQGSPKKCYPQVSSHALSAASPTKSRPAVQLNLLSPSRKMPRKTSSPGSLVSSPCTHPELGTDPYGDYAVPRTALAHIYIKDQPTNSSVASTPSGDLNSDSTRVSILSSDSSEYDVPRRIKDCLGPMECKENVLQNPLVPQPTLGPSLRACMCGGWRSGEVARPIPPLCPCQRVMNWAENLMPCRRRKASDEVEPLCSHGRTVVEVKTTPRGPPVHHAVHLCSCPHGSIVAYPALTGATAKPPCPPPPPPPPQSGVTSVLSDNPSRVEGIPAEGDANYANLDFIKVREGVVKCGQAAAAAAASQADMSNYANLQFVKSLPLYENANAVLSKAGIAMIQDAPNPELDSSLNIPEQNTAAAAACAQDTPVQANANEAVPAKPIILFGVETRCLSCGHHFIRPQSDSNDGEQFLQVVKKEGEGADATDEKANYLMMQPTSGRCTPNPRTPAPPTDTGKGASSDLSSPSPSPYSEYMQMSDIIKDLKSLPLRPFMPLELPSRRGGDTKPSSTSEPFRGRSASNGSADKCSLLGGMTGKSFTEPRTVRSNSVVELKKRVFLRKRSSSADSRQDNTGITDSETDEPGGLLSPSLSGATGRRAASFLTKFNTLKSKDRYRSSDEISQSAESSRASTPNNQSEESLEDKHSFEPVDVDFVLRNLEAQMAGVGVGGDGERSESRASGTIKRSSSVPCNPSNRDSASSSDSGVSTGSPKQITLFPCPGSDPSGAYMEMAVLKPSCNTGGQKAALVLRLRRQDSACKMLHQEGSEAPVWIKREDFKDCSPSQEMLSVHHYSVDSKSTSSTTSDMSDYIETLSLSSHGSSDVPRTDDTTWSSAPPSATSTLRPRSGREYQTVDRSLLEECLLQSHMYSGADCLSSSSASSTYTVAHYPVDATRVSKAIADLHPHHHHHHHHHQGATTTTTAQTQQPLPEKVDSPSPGYMSSSPAPTEREGTLSPSGGFPSRR